MDKKNHFKSLVQDKIYTLQQTALAITGIKTYTHFLRKNKTLNC